MANRDMADASTGPEAWATAVADNGENGLEAEEEDPTEIKRPFDPEKIKVRTSQLGINLLVARIDHDEIFLTPDFQRMVGIWDKQRKSRLIESLLLRIPIPVFYVAADEEDKWTIVDGLQRTSAIHDYVSGGYALAQLEYLTKFNGLGYGDLPRPMQRRIDETQLIVNIIEPGTPEEVMFNIFRRINTGGLTLNGQEIRHALHRGPVLDFLRKLAESTAFQKATDGSVSSKRMADRECILRFLAFHIEPWERYSATDDLDGYLGTAMEKINAMKASERERLECIFTKAMDTANSIFGRRAFRKCYDKDGWRYPVNKALFETWSEGLARRSDSEREALVANRSEVFEGFLKLMNTDRDFIDAISASTGDVNRLRTRFEAVDRLIKDCLDA